MDPKSDGRNHSSEYAAYPRLAPEDVAPPPPPVVPPSATAAAAAAGSNPYIVPFPSPNPPPKSAGENLRDMLGMVGKKVGEAARKTEGIAGDVWQHLKTGPSVADATMGRIAQISKVILEGGYDKIFQQTFDSAPDEKLKKAYACYLSTSSGPIMGVLYLSTAKLAFCSDSPVSCTTGDNKTESSFYKVFIPLLQLRSATPSASRQNPAEKYIQIVSVDNHEFWFMGFVNYDSAIKNLQEAVHGA